MNVDLDATEQLLVRFDDARLMLGNIGRSKMYNLISEGALTKVDIGHACFITTESLRAYVAGLQAQQAKAAGEAGDD